MEEAPPLPKAALIIGAVLVLCFGGPATLVAIADPPSQRPGATSDNNRRPPAAGTKTGSSAGTPAATAEPSPTIEKRTVTETQPIPFTETTVQDPSLPGGTREVRTPGVDGVKTLTYEVTLTNGVQTDKKLLQETVTKPPVNQVVAIGTKAEQRCDPNYSGACVPIASDVDCAGGSGNGPAYVKGPVRVIGTDIYDLDHDGDGIGCE